MTEKTILVTGAAGFIGSHLVDTLLQQGCTVIGIDNLIRGKLANLKQAQHHPKFIFIQQDISEDYVKKILEASHGKKIEAVWHFAANSDIPAGVNDPGVDLKHTFMTTFHTLTVMKELTIPIIYFASTSAVYGALSGALVEDMGPLFPISAYGAMKLASEAMISAALETFLTKAYIFRFPNVVGSRATHGVIYDLMHKLKINRETLEVLGDGKQQKAYLHVSELLNAMHYIAKHSNEKINFFNIAAEDEGIYIKDIAQKVIDIASPAAKINYTGGSQGWPGDVPRFKYSIEKLKKLGWKANWNSHQTIDNAVKEIYQEILV